jgi:hypothetical protein
MSGSRDGCPSRLPDFLVRRARRAGRGPDPEQPGPNGKSGSRGRGADLLCLGRLTQLSNAKIIGSREMLRFRPKQARTR